MPEADVAAHSKPEGKAAPLAAGDVLVVIAHPDDELFASGAICLCADAGLCVRIVAVTNGEGGGLEIVCASSPAELAKVRQDELTRSAQALGAERPAFLNQADVAEPNGVWDTHRVTAAIASLLRETRPIAVFTHGPRGGYGHPAHRLTHRCVMEAVAEAGFEGAVFSFCGAVKDAFFSWHFDQPSDVRIDARGFLARRVASLVSHRSQGDYFLRPYAPRTLRKHLSALFGYAFAFTEAGRKRVPIGTPERFFERLPVEGFALQKAPEGVRPHLFLEWFSDDPRVAIDR